jgi:2-iminobutanoate/2-iminopropanoate deaminase
MKTLSLIFGLLLLARVAGQQTGTNVRPPDRKFIVLPRPDAIAHAPFSDAVLVGNTLYVAGQIGLDPATGKPGATAVEEAQFAMEAVKRIVKAAGMTMDELVSVQVFCADVSDFETFNSVYRTYFSDNYPARAFLGSGKLLFGARFEVTGIAVKRH